MIEPELAELAAGVHDGWGLDVASVEPAPGGLDRQARTYLVSITGDGYRFLKVRLDDFAPRSIQVPEFLAERGLSAVVAPIGPVRRSGALRLALYPFVPGGDLWRGGLTETQWFEYGRFLGEMHALELPDDMAGLVPAETYETTAPQRIRDLAGTVENHPDLGPLWRDHAALLLALADEVDVLRRAAAADREPAVLCHGDIHPANLMADADGQLRVVDWDEPVRAPRERDLMFVLSGDYGMQPINARREAMFRSGYGRLDVDTDMLRYYRVERWLDDIALFNATVLDPASSEQARRDELAFLVGILRTIVAEETRTAGLDPGEAVRLTALVRASDWMMRVLRTVRDSGLPDAWVGAGSLRDLVWSGDGFDPARVRDVDVAFFDPYHLSRDGDRRATEALASAWPDVPWEAVNQAAVHTWYGAHFGDGVSAPLTSIADAIGTWPETATAVAVRLSSKDQIEICAPFGLTDLLAGVWRRNGRVVPVERSRQRLARHRPGERWPWVTVIEPGSAMDA